MKGRKGRQMILAGIVTYNPDIDRLRECIDAVLPQVDKVLVFDNASTNIEQVLQIVGDYQEGVILHMNGVNAGVAAALSEIMEYALDNGYDIFPNSSFNTLTPIEGHQEDLAMFYKGQVVSVRIMPDKGQKLY